jgi:hypothetical protein
MSTESGAEHDFDAADLGGGRKLPPLLFATSRDALGAKFGPERVAKLLDGLRAAGHSVVDTIPVGTLWAATAAAPIHAALARNPVEGVIILGGYDVMPAEVMDCIPYDIRRIIKPQVDPGDDFFVWSDDIYADTDGDNFAELPVSRIPDGNDFQLVTRALRAQPARHPHQRAGISNAYRPFAAGVFKQLPGAGKMVASEPFSTADHNWYSMCADRLYLVLHGGAENGARYCGQRKDESLVEAVNLEVVPETDGTIILSGVCWGALLVDQLPRDYSRGQLVTPRTADNSIALRFLRHGALAFVGTTGAHHSPITKPFQYLSGVLHRDFWAETVAGTAPAPALLRAKELFANGLPRFPVTPSTLPLYAQELKALRQFTCLGLGW